MARGFVFELPEDDPEGQPAARALGNAMYRRHAGDPADRAARHEPRLALPWAGAAGMFNAGLTMTPDYDLHPIGIVRSPLANRSEAPRQGDEGAPDAVIELAAEVQCGLRGIAAGDELVVVTWLHESRRDVLETRPRDDLARPLAGVFATRSPDRPNPLGLHRVTVRAIAGNELTVGPLEAIDGTPVVDLKPVLRASADD